MDQNEKTRLMVIAPLATEVLKQMTAVAALQQVTLLRLGVSSEDVAAIYERAREEGRKVSYGIVRELISEACKLSPDADTDDWWKQGS